MDSLKIENLTKFFGGLGAVHEVSFSIHPGEVCSLIGPERSGEDDAV